MNATPSRPLAIFGAVVAGGFMAVQARVNSGLAAEIDSGYLAAFISFAIGLGLISMASLPRRKFRADLRRAIELAKEGSFPAWMLASGALGGFFVLTQGLVAGVTGIALFSLGVVTGQTVSALLIDGRGLFGLEKRALSSNRLLGSLLALAGLMLASDPSISGIQLVLFVPLVAGFGIGLQDAINSRVGRSTGSAAVATFFNFLAGTIFLLIVLLFSGIPDANLTAVNPTLYIGGLVGVSFILIRVLVLPVIGSLATGLSLLTGQIFVSLALDFLVPVTLREITAWTFAGLLLVFAGAALASRR
ncbi:MAG: DMT family transporter [Aquiluna sp.]